MSAINPLPDPREENPLRMSPPIGLDDETPIGTFIKHDFKVLIPREAQEFVEKIDREYQRKKRDPVQIDRLAHLISRNEFPLARLMLVQCPWDPGFPWKLADGASTSEAIVKANRPVRASILYWRCDHKHQWPKVWGSAGLDAKTRGWVDEARQIINCGGYEIPIHVPPADVNKFRNGAEMYIKRVEGGDVEKIKADRLEVLNEYTQAFDVFQNCCRETMWKALLKRPSVVCAIIWSVEACREEVERLNRKQIRGASQVLDWAREFWVETFSGMFTVSDKYYPPFRLHQWLRMANYLPVDEAEAVPTSRQTAGAGKLDTVAACVNCWNAWLDGRKIKQIKTVTKGKLPPCQGAGMPRSYSGARGAEFFGPPRIVS